MSDEQQQGSVRPYGDAIAQAAQRGDLQEMEDHADAARRALAGEPHPPSAAVRFHQVLDHEREAVMNALRTLETKIGEMRKPKQ
ncbi:MAG TPA: DUF1843 domain-containing protein [Candidatus Elarobacter sp.]|jgi:hypothetical protein